MKSQDDLNNLRKIIREEVKIYNNVDEGIVGDILAKGKEYGKKAARYVGKKLSDVGKSSPAKQLDKKDENDKIFDAHIILKTIVAGLPKEYYDKYYAGNYLYNNNRNIKKYLQ